MIKLSETPNGNEVVHTIRSGIDPVSGVLITGSASDDTKSLLVCIHGGGCNAGYFNIKGYSTVAQATARGIPVLLVNRPGYGGNPALPGDRPIADMVPIIRSFVDQVRSEHLPRSDELTIIGHSIGGAVALTLAGHRGDWPLRAIAVSGIGDAPSSDIMKWFIKSPDAFPPPESVASLFFGPEGSYSWQAPIALRKISEPWQSTEVQEVVYDWRERWPGIATKIDVPVHLRLAEHEKVWETGRPAIDRMTRSLVKSPHVDASILPDGGHLYELHKRGHELVASQLAFLEAFTGRTDQKTTSEE